MATPASSSSLCFSSNYPSAQLSTPQQHTTSINLSSKLKSLLLQKHPFLEEAQANLSFQFKEKVLCLEIMGIDSGRALSLNPSLQTASLNSIHSIISYLQSKGIHQKDMGRILGMCPKILTLNIKSDLSPVFAFLSQDLGVPSQGFRRVIKKCPRLLACSVKDQLKPALFYLQRLGFEDLEALAYQDPVLLVSSVENTLIPKLEYLMSLGFSKDEAKGMVLRCPGLFTFSVERNYIPKFEYCVEEMKGKLEELKEFPHYFAFSLEKRIRPRHVEAIQSGVELSLSQMLKTSDEEFKELIVCGRSTT